jgi:hypothetical protein
MIACKDKWSSSTGLTDRIVNSPVGLVMALEVEVLSTVGCVLMAGYLRLLWHAENDAPRANLIAHYTTSVSRRFLGTTHRCGYIRDSGVETHSEWNLSHVNWIDTTSRLALLPSTDFGGKHHPSDLRAECKPSARIRCTAKEFHFQIFPRERMAVIGLCLGTKNSPADVLAVNFRTAVNRSSSGEPPLKPLARQKM